ncbi:MAG: MCE family protein, partial [bacterium]
MLISSRNRSVKIGVISLWGLTLFLIIFIVFVIGKNQKLFAPKYSLYMFIPNAQGLNPGAFITLSGLKVGVVGEMDFIQKDDKQGIRVDLKINRKFAHMITASSMATINTMGMLGDKYVDILLGDLSDPVLEKGAFIKTLPPLDLTAIASNAAAAISELQLTLANINKI